MEAFSRETWVAESRALADGIVRSAAFWAAMNLSLWADQHPDNDWLRAAAGAAQQHYEDVSVRSAPVEDEVRVGRSALR